MVVDYRDRKCLLRLSGSNCSASKSERYSKAKVLCHIVKILRKVGLGYWRRSHGVSESSESNKEKDVGFMQ
jgi:hypothetical protein